MASLISDKDVDNLREIKKILQEIKELNIGVDLSNVIEADEDTILLFNTNNFMLKDIDLKNIGEKLSKELGHHCIVLNSNIELNKAIKSKEIDYVTETNYADGEIIKEVTTQYK